MVLIYQNQFRSFNYSRIQDLDGGFFEKFGSLLRQKSVMDEEQLTTPLAPLPEIVQEVEGEEPAIQMRILDVAEEAESDSGNETLHDTDSEPEDDGSKQLDFVEGAMGWNVSNIWLFSHLKWHGAKIKHSVELQLDPLGLVMPLINSPLHLKHLLQRSLFRIHAIWSMARVCRELPT